MKLTGKLFKEIASIMKAIVNTNSTLPYLQNSLVQIKNSGLILTSTDLDISARIFVQNKTWEADKDTETFLMDTKILHSFISKCDTNESVDISTNKLTCGKVSKILKNKTGETAIEQFPTCDFFDSELVPTLTINGNYLVETVDYLNQFVAKDDYKATLNGMYFNVGKEEICATDGHAMMLRSGVPFAFVDDKMPNFILPTEKLVKIFKKIKQNCDKNISVKIKGHTGVISLDFEEYRLDFSMRLVEGEYPPYNKVMSPAIADNTIKYSIDCTDIEKINKFFDGGSTNQVRIRVDSNKNITFSEDIIDAGKTVINSLIDTEVPEHTYGVNYTFLNKFIQSKDQETIKVSVKDSESAIIIEIPNNYTGLLMPVRLSSYSENDD